jgi:hypothetical protein
MNWEHVYAVNNNDDDDDDYRGLSGLMGVSNKGVGNCNEVGRLSSKAISHYPKLGIVTLGMCNPCE